MIGVLVAVLLTSPSDAGVCFTKCGMSAAANCGELQRIETAFVREMGKTPGLTPVVVCSALNGWEVVARKLTPADDAWCQGGWFFPLIRSCVTGLTTQETHTLEVTSTDWQSTVLVHEMAHAVDLATRKVAGHCDWERRGVYRVFKTVMGREDLSTREVCDEPDAGL